MLYKRIVCFVWIFLCITQFASAQQWNTEKANQWYASQPWIVGCNFIPIPAINPLEMWQAETFDSLTIDRELGWAANIGMNTCRVFLHDLAYKADPDGFKQRIDCYLRIAHKHDIKTSLGIVMSIVESVRISAMVVLLIAGAVLFGRFLTVSRLPFELAEWAAALPVAPFVILLVVLGIYIIGGMLMDALGFLVVTIPIFFPLSVALGYDPVWYTVILTIVTTMGAVTPPVGVNVFIVHGLAPEIPIHTIFRGVMYFMVSFVICIVLMWVFPATVTGLPNWMLGAG